ncbi:MAG TPA: AMP-binding protein [Burkholderiales bacterium]|nr:AMP-binding protein [Burkholderiales bacterium]
MAPELALIERFRADDAIGWRGGEAIDAARFCGTAIALAARLPRKRHVLNLCEDRLSFMLGFAAAMVAGQVSLLPYSRAPGAVLDLLASQPDAYCLSDGEDPPPGLPAFITPDFAQAGGTFDVPRFGADRLALIAYTSGSTGRPQPHAQTWGSLVADARALGAHLGLAAGGACSIVGTVPPQHIYGMETTVMLPLQNGVPVHSGRPLLPADIAAALSAMRGRRWLVTTPAHLRACAEESVQSPPLAGILSATMPLGADLARRIERRWSAPVHEIYGCTEGGALALRRPALEENWRVREGMRLRRSGGETWVEGGHLAQPLRIPDRVEVLSETQFRLLGRPEDMAKIAGKRASIEALNRELLRVPGVKDGAFFDPGNAARGVTRLAAVAVAPGVDAESILHVLRERIDPAFLPRPLILVEALPRTATGKVARAELLELFEAAAARNRNLA